MVVLELDRGQVVAMLRSTTRNRSEIGHIIEESKGILGEWKISRVKSDCNRVANSLASLARRSKHSAAGSDRHLYTCTWDLLNVPSSSLKLEREYGNSHRPTLKSRKKKTRFAQYLLIIFLGIPNLQTYFYITKNTQQSIS
jgi:hypothetical protein